jgi:phosphoglycerate dehydrogenase-like enzyme
MGARYAELLRASLALPHALRCAGADPDAWADALATAEVVISMDWPATSPPAPKLRLLHLPGAGTDSVDVAALPEGCAACNVFEHEVPIAEYCMRAMLEHAIGVTATDRRFRSGDWSDSLVAGGPTHGELQGRVLGILGYGRIGRALAKRADAFGMEVRAVTAHPVLEPPLAEAVTPDRLAEAAVQYDYLVVACPLTPVTHGMVDARVLAAMKPEAVLINVGRGLVVDEQALFRSLERGDIGGAVIDVWYRYPGPDGPRNVRPSQYDFESLPNVWMTPHTSAWSTPMLERRFVIIADNIVRMREGRPLLNRFA